MAFQPQLDANASEPLYRQLVGAFVQAIEAGQLGEGDRLPPTRDLANTLQLARATVTQAYDLLESEGYISQQVGRGSFVLPRKLVPKQANPIGPIGLDSSRPADDLLPIEEFQATAQEVLRSNALPGLLQLGAPAGYGPLRHYLLDQARRRGEAGPDDDVAIVNGCQQGLDLVQRVLGRPGEPVAIEDPVYPGVRSLFERAGARVVGVPLTWDRGVSLDQLERVLERERPRLLVLTPNFQNPTGGTLPLQARREIVDLANRAGVTIVENDVYGSLRYTGEPVPTLKQLDDSVILLRSYSKVAFPGLRVGWVIAPRGISARLAEAKQWSDLHTDQLSQGILLRWAESGRLDAQIERALTAGRARLAAALGACQEFLPPGTQWTRPEGGMSLWVRLPDGLDAETLLAEALREGVSYRAGRVFSVTTPQPAGLRLCFAAETPERVREGIRRLAVVAGRVRAVEEARAMV